MSLEIRLVHAGRMIHSLCCSSQACISHGLSTLSALGTTTPSWSGCLPLIKYMNCWNIETSCNVWKLVVSQLISNQIIRLHSIDLCWKRRSRKLFERGAGLTLLSARRLLRLYQLPAGRGWRRGVFAHALFTQGRSCT